MAILKLSNELRGVISASSLDIKEHTQSRIDNFIKDNDTFQLIYENAEKLFTTYDFVVIKNIDFHNSNKILESFIKLFGDFYGDSIEYAKIKIDCDHTACNAQLIELHNDDMIALEKIPKIGFIQVINEDPLKLAKNGLVKISEVVNYLKCHDDELLTNLLNKKVPMMTYGINYNDKNKEWNLLNETILYETANGTINVRFDLGVINTYYWKKKIKQPIKEKKMINDFLNICKKMRKEFYLEYGDILVYNNKTLLHDRTETAIELNLDGSLNTREIFVGFIKNDEE